MLPSFFYFKIMVSIGEHYNKVKVTLNEAKITADLFAYIRSIENVLVDYNVSQINDDSKDIFGKPIGFYSKATENITHGQKREGQPFTGYNTGNWLEQFFLRPVNGGFMFYSKDPKTRFILSDDPRNTWLSKDLFGLSDENLNEAIKLYFLPYFLNYFRNAL